MKIKSFAKCIYFNAIAWRNNKMRDVGAVPYNKNSLNARYCEVLVIRLDYY